MDSRVRVLFVDDDPAFVSMAAETLEREDDRLTVETELTVEGALDRLDSEPVDCVVSDYKMSDRDGIEFLQAVRDREPDLPFIIYTAKGSEEVASEAVSAGVTDYFQKSGGSGQYAILANRITNAVESARAQRARDRQLEAIEAAQEGIAILDEDGTFTYVNEAYTDLYGYDPAEMIGEHWGLIYRNEDIQYIREEVLPSVEESGHWHGTTTGVRADGSTFVEDHVLAQTERDNLVCTVSEAEESTASEDPERLKQEIERRKATETRYRSLFENSPIVIWEDDLSAAKAYVDELAAEADDLEAYLEANPDEVRALMDRVQIIDVNETAVEYYGAPSKTALIDDLGRVFTRDSWGSVVQLWTMVANGETQFRTEGVVETFEGERRELIFELYVPDAYADSYSRAYITGTDITERRERERELQRQNRRLDEFTSVVSHDLRNPLNAAGLRLGLALDECDSEHLPIVDRNLDRMEQLIEDLLSFARAGQEIQDSERIHLSTIATNCWHNVVTEDASLEVDVDTSIIGDTSRLQQLLENLYRNAVEHSEGAVTVRVGSLADGFYIEDDGPGIPESKREQVFESGYSTAEEGTGFGLRIVEQIVDAHGWEIHVTDSDEGGARFEITGVEEAA